MNERLAELRVFRGAKVRTHTPPMSNGPVLHPHVEHRGAIGYELALANRHKSWAKRWLRQYRPGKFV